MILVASRQILYAKSGLSWSQVWQHGVIARRVPPRNLVFAEIAAAKDTVRVRTPPFRFIPRSSSDSAHEGLDELDLFLYTTLHAPRCRTSRPMGRRFSQERHGKYCVMTGN
jgi:hypothetical protein